MPTQHRGPDGSAVHSRVAGELVQLSKVCGQLGVVDLVEEYFTPIVGRWSAMHDEAERWRSAAETAEEVTGRLTGPLGGLDAAWQGADADSFISYIRSVGLAGNDLADAMHAVAVALDSTAGALREITVEMSDVLAELAGDVTRALDAPAGGPAAVRDHLDEQRDQVSAMYESAVEVLDAFTRFSERLAAGGSGAAGDGVTMRHELPATSWAPDAQRTPGPPDTTGTVSASRPPAVQLPPDQTSAVTAATSSTAPAGAEESGVVPSSEQVRQQLAGGSVADATGQSVAATSPEPAAPAPDPQPQSGGRGGIGMMPMMGGMGGNQGGDKEHKSKLRISADPKEIFGEPEKTAPPVIGEQPKPKPEE